MAMAVATEVVARDREQEQEQARQVEVAFARALEVRVKLKIPPRNVSATFVRNDRGIGVFRCRAGANGTSAIGEAYYRPENSVSVHISETKVDGARRFPVESWLRVQLT